LEVSDGASTSKPTQTPPSLGLGCKVQERRPWCQPPTVAQGMRASTHQARAIGRMAVWPQHPMTLSMMTLHSLQISLAVCPPATKISLGMRMPHRLAAHHCKQPSLSVFSRRNSIRSPCYKFHLKSPPPPAPAMMPACGCVWIHQNLPHKIQIFHHIKITSKH